MIMYIFNILFYTIKLLAIPWFFNNDQIFFKLIIISLLSLSIICLYKYPKPLENKLNVIADYYKIHNKYDKVFSFFMLLLYIIFFIGGIFYLRYMNKDKILNLKLFFNTLYNKLVYCSPFVNIINILLLLIIIIFYILLLLRLTKIFKRYFIKIHIYYSKFDDNWYDTYIKKFIKYKYGYTAIIPNTLFRRFRKLWRIDFIGFPLEYHLIMIAKSIHYFILIFVLFYDIIFNNMILSNIYTILPYIFLYDLYIRTSNLYDSLDRIYFGDFTLNDYIYADYRDITIISKDEIWIKGEPYSTERISKLVFVYLKYGLNAEALDKVLNNDMENIYKYNYYKDWKHRKNK